VIVDTTGIPEVISEAFNKLAPGGTLVLVGQPKPNLSLEFEGLSFFDGQGRTIKATQGGRTIPQSDIPRYIKLAERGVLNVDKLHTHTFELKDVNDAFDLLKSGNAGRIMVKIND